VLSAITKTANDPSFVFSQLFLVRRPTIPSFPAASVFWNRLQEKAPSPRPFLHSRLQSLECKRCYGPIFQREMKAASLISCFGDRLVPGFDPSIEQTDRSDGRRSRDGGDASTARKRRQPRPCRMNCDAVNCRRESKDDEKYGLLRLSRKQS